MSIVSAIVLFAMIWFLVLLIVLPIGLKTQGDVGKVTHGTPSSAPAKMNLRRRAKITTIWAVIIWAVIAAIILSEAIEIRDFDIRGVLPPVQK